MRKKDFNTELIFFLEKLKSYENFCLSRWGDGELMILDNNFIDLTEAKNGEFKYIPNDNEYNELREVLIQSYQYCDDNYYIGIACPCCVGYEKFNYMRSFSKQNEDSLTWANIFVNSNYKNFIEKYVEIFKNRNISMVINDQANANKLEFNVNRIYNVGVNAWLKNYSVIKQIKNDIEKNKIENEVFLFSAGPLSNMLTYELWKFNKNNTYIDIGSVFDVMMGMKPTRGYHLGADTLTKKCIW